MPELSLTRTDPEQAACEPNRTGLSLRDRIEADLNALFGPADVRAQDGGRGVFRFRGVGGKLEAVEGQRALAAIKRNRRGPEGTAGELVYAVGDIHGRYDLLLQLLQEIAQDAPAQAQGRTPLVILLGDYVDRGPCSRDVLEAVVQLQQRFGFRFCLLKGNHEQALLDFLDRPERGAAWLGFGGAATLSSYGVAPPDPLDPAALGRARDELLAAMPAAHLRLLQGLDLMVVVGDYAFVHAGVAPGAALQSQREADLLWIRGEFLEHDRPADRVIVHGHTWAGAEPELHDHRIGVDTGAFATGALTAVRLDGAERKVLQAWDPQSSWKPQAPAAPLLVSRPVDFTAGGLEVNFNAAVARSAAANSFQPRSN